MANRNPPNQDKLKRGGPGRPKGSKNKLTVERVEEEIRRIALMDPLALFGRVHGTRRRFTMREIADMDPEIRACIASVKVKTENLTAGDDRQDQTVEIKLWNKNQALELCAKHFKWIADKETTVILDATIEDRLTRGRSRNAERERD